MRKASVLGIACLVVVGCTVNADPTPTPTPAADAAPEASSPPPAQDGGAAEYERSASAESDAGAFVIAVARCDLGDELVDGSCSEAAPYWHPQIPTLEEGPGRQCGNYGAVTVTIRCADVTPGEGR